jgi:hypothetical protein
MKNDYSKLIGKCNWRFGYLFLLINFVMIFGGTSSVFAQNSKFSSAPQIIGLSLNELQTFLGGEVEYIQDDVYQFWHYPVYGIVSQFYIDKIVGVYRWVYIVVENDNNLKAIIELFTKEYGSPMGTYPLCYWYSGLPDSVKMLIVQRENLETGPFIGVKFMGANK